MSAILATTEDIAVKELEAILTKSGYVDWESIYPATEGQFEQVIREQVDPIFYRATTPAAAPIAMIGKPQSLPQRASLFLLYGLLAPGYHSADNRVRAVTVRFSLTIQYDTKFLFWNNGIGETGNQFIPYLSSLLDHLENAGFSISQTIGEASFPSTEGGQQFNYRKQFMITKTY